MNFKLLILFIFISSCGLKTKPKAPEGTKLPSILDEYTKKEKKKKKTK